MKKNLIKSKKMPKKQIPKDPLQPTMTQAMREINERMEAESQKKLQVTTQLEENEVQILEVRTVTPKEEKHVEKKRKFDLDDFLTGDLDRKMACKPVKEEKEEDKEDKEKEDYINHMQEKEYMFTLRDNDPLKQPLPNFMKYLKDDEFLLKYHSHLLSNLELWAENKLKLLDEFMGKTAYPDDADGGQRDFITNLMRVKNLILDLPIPLGMIEKKILHRYLQVDLDDEIISFFYYLARSPKFILKFYIHEHLFNYELSTVWILEDDTEEHSYGKGDVEDLCYLDPEDSQSQALLPN